MSYVLDSKTLLLAGALGRPLALAASALGQSFGVEVHRSCIELRSAAGGVSGSMFDPEDDEDDEDEEDDDEDAIALVHVSGPLAQRGREDMCAAVDGYDWITARLATALDKAGAVVLVIDSPGGDGAGLPEAVRRCRGLVEASGKPCLAYVDEMAASAAYWLASGVADALYLPSSGEVGSIGAICVHADESAAAEKDGVKYTIVRKPSGKAVGNSLEPLGDVGRARIESAVSDLESRFVESVAARRGLSASAIRKLDADMLRGADAVAAGLADGVATLEQVIDLAAQKAAERKSNMSLRESVGRMLRAPAGASDADLAKSVEAAEPIFDLGRLVLGLAGGGDAVAATRLVAGWKADSDRAAADAPKREKKKVEKRVKLVQALVRGGFKPAALWLDAAAGAAVGNIAEPYASMTLEQLEAMAGGLAAPAFAARVEGDVVKAEQHAAAESVELTIAEKHLAKIMGMDPEKVRAHKAALAAGKAA